MSATPDETRCNAPRDIGAELLGDDGIVVLGVGNVLWADEGFGVRCVEALQARYRFAPHVRLVDGGTQGLYLIPQVHAAGRLLIFDAVDYGLPPGTLKVVENTEVPRFLGAKKMSLHQTGLQEVLLLADLLGRYPAEVLLIGCQPEELEDYGGSLRPSVRRALDDALAVAIQRLEAWGAQPVPRAQPLDGDEAVTAACLGLTAYEEGRPSADAACRVGDARLLAGSAGAAKGGEG